MNYIETKSAIQVHNLVKSRTPIIYIVSHDEEHCIKELYKKLCIDNNGNPSKHLYIWSANSGIIEYTDGYFTLLETGKDKFENSNSPTVALNIISTFIPDDGKDCIFLFKDFHTILNMNTARQLKDMYTYLAATQKPHKTVIGLAGMIGHFHGAIKGGLEPSLEKQVAIVRWDYPTREQIEEFLRYSFSISKQLSKTDIKVPTEEEFFDLSRSLQGLNFVEINSAVAVCWAELKKLSPTRLMQEKKQIILRGDILEFIESNNTLDDLGGLDNLKQYIKDHKNSNAQEAIEFGVDPIKGIILVGIPGAGKSASAKSIGNTWGIPTLRLDVGKVMHGLVGGSEQRMREVVAQAKAVAPCVLWIDEVEKGLSGTKSSNFSDGGTLSRVFGTLLTAMEEEFNQFGIVVIATANDISMLPPELIRRFSETFYVGLPTINEREEIWKIHLTKKKRDCNQFDLHKLAIASKNFTGAEIQKSLLETISVCWNDNKKIVSTDEIIKSIKATKPLYTVMEEVIKNTEKWAKDRARFASSFGEKEVKSPSISSTSGQQFNLNNLNDEVEID